MTNPTILDVAPFDRLRSACFDRASLDFSHMVACHGHRDDYGSREGSTRPMLAVAAAAAQECRRWFIAVIAFRRLFAEPIRVIRLWGIAILFRCVSGRRSALR